MNAKKIRPSDLIPNRRWLRREHLESLLEFCRETDGFSLETIGESHEGRSIESVTWGQGPNRILAWTQMHGNEPTATLAIADLLEFLAKEDTGLFDSICFKVILMLNPDGSERFQRRSALGIDLNRDAASRQSAEIKAYFKSLESFKPHWAFNLHDQRNIYAAGDGPHTATMSFLAPAADESRTLTDTRLKAIKLISSIYQHLEPHLPNHFARYNDEFYPRALGDNLMKMGIPTILFEAGHFPGDDLRQKARALNAMGLFHAFQAIADESWQKQSEGPYFSIPENRSHLRDIIFRKVKVADTSFDLALMKIEQPDLEKDGMIEIYQVDDLGDLPHYQGILELEGGELEIEGDLHPNQLANFKIDSDKIYEFIHGVLQEH